MIARTLKVTLEFSKIMILTVTRLSKRCCGVHKGIDVIMSAVCKALQSSWDSDKKDLPVELEIMTQDRITGPDTRMDGTKQNGTTYCTGGTDSRCCGWGWSQKGPNLHPTMSNRLK